MEKARYSVSQITQGKHKFYTLTIPSDVLAKCCFATSREEDPSEGFQRLLDRKRAEEIAKYIDSGLGTIPSSIVLSAQPAAEFQIIGRGKTAEFNISPKAFLILDGQHRVYGFTLARSHLRVPVVVYNGLSRRDETRLFIDINSKQKGVPNELLLDIKSLAEYESDSEQTMRELFDQLNDDIGSRLYGLLSPANKSKQKISRVTFNAALRPLLPIFESKSYDEMYDTLNSYFIAFCSGLREIGCDEQITNSTVFKAASAFFPTVASKVKDRHGAVYNVDNFFDILGPTISSTSPNKFKKPGNSFNELVSYLETKIKSGFTL
ncbi:TPA: DGQHR domain-containing protein [Pseudomonas aeruginosa]|nr:DGQHR domain-containing protein [Pseudomonas aeruginosa]HBO2991609.1 DGQHR domain-containing protein [Pseudomonas aeruginosa]